MKLKQSGKSHIAIAASVALNIFALGCGSTKLNNAPSSGASEPRSNNNDDDQSGIVKGSTDDGSVKLLNPPKGYYDAAYEYLLLSVEKKQAAGSVENLVFLNFDGTTVRKGFGARQAFFINEDMSLNPAPFDEATQQQITADIQSVLEQSGAKINIVTDHPTSSVFTEIVIAESQAVTADGTLGLAALDKGNINPSDIAIAFASAGQDPQDIADNAVQAIIGTFGFASLSDPNIVSIGQNFANLGTVVPGGANLDALGKLVGDLTAQNAVNLQTIAPLLNGVLPSSMNLTGFDMLLPALGLLQQAAQKTSNPTGINGILGKLIADPNALASGGSLSLVSGFAGFLQPSSALTSIIGIITNQAQNNSVVPGQITAIPDVKSLLAIGGITDPATLLGQILPLQSQQILQGGNSINVQNALTALLKLGYAQALVPLKP